MKRLLHQDIPEEYYKAIMEIPIEQSTADMLIIRDGTPLPKGHGRLIDADKIKTNFQEHHDFYVNAYGGFKNLPRNEKARVDEITSSIATVVNAPTIIEAYKAESEKSSQD